MSDEQEKPPFPDHLSPSQISTLLTCGHQYYLSRVLKVPSRPMWAGIGGTVVHKLIEELDREWYAKNHPQAG